MQTKLYGDLSVDDVLGLATPEIDVLAILSKGERYAKKIASRLNGRGTLYGINPYSSHVYPLGVADTLGLREQDYDSWDHMMDEYLHLMMEGVRVRILRSRDEPFCQEMPRLNPANSLIICDDVLETGRTYSNVLHHLSEDLGYDFRAESPLHFSAFESVIDWDEIGHTDGSGGCYSDQIRVARF